MKPASPPAPATSFTLSWLPAATLTGSGALLLGQQFSFKRQLTPSQGRSSTSRAVLRGSKRSLDLPEVLNVVLWSYTLGKEALS